MNVVSCSYHAGALYLITMPDFSTYYPPPQSPLCIVCACFVFAIVAWCRQTRAWENPQAQCCCRRHPCVPHHVAASVLRAILPPPIVLMTNIPRSIRLFHRYAVFEQDILCMGIESAQCFSSFWWS